ncbi:MAG TPA: histidine phosphatase family protein, partial [Tahibacter sp.]|nr:histidine phosphatase family protein [Tahibacter sp.]
QDAARYRHWADNWLIQEAPGGESFSDVIRRTGAWLAALLGSTGDNDCVLTMAHAGSIRALLCHALGLPPARAFALKVDLARASRIRYRLGQFEVSYTNASRFEDD